MRRLVITLIAFLSVVVSEARTGVALNAVTEQTPTTGQPGVAEASQVIRQRIKDGQYRDAEIAARSLLARVQASNAQESIEMAEVLDLLVESLWQGGRFSNDEGRRLAEQAVAVKERLGATEPSLARSLFHLAAWHSQSGDHATAKPLFERTLELRERALGADHPDVAFTLNVFGSSRTAAGDYREARRMLERGLAIRQTVLGPDHLDVAGSLNNLAVLLEKTGDLIQVRSLIERALAIWEKWLPPEHPRIGLGVANLAVANAALGDHARASPLFERGLAIQEKMSPDSPSVALTLRNLASSLMELGQYSAARPHLERALAMFERASGPNHPAVALSLIQLGSFLRETGDTDRAKANFERAVAIFERVLGPEHPYLALGQYEFAVLFAETGAIGLSGEMAIRADAITREHARLTASTLPEREALQYSSRKPPALHLVLTLAADGMDTSPLLRRNAFDAIVRSRALVLDEMATRHRTVAWAKDPEVSRLASELAAAREDLARRVVRGPGADPPERYKSLVLNAREQKDRAERSLAEKSLAFRNEQIRNRANLDDVSAALSLDGALVAFVRYRSFQLAGERPKAKPPAWVPAYLALVLRGGERDPALVPLGRAEAIDALVSRWREQVAQEALAPGRASRRTEATYRLTATELRQKVWDPVAPHLQGIKSVFLVPDGSLHLVNFAALPVGQTNYLVERGPLIHYLSAERDLVLTAPEHANGGLLALGSPAFDDTGSFAALKPETGGGIELAAGATFRGSRPDCVTFESMRFAPLPDSAREAKEIVALWEKTRVKQTNRGAQLRSAAQETAGRVRYLTGPAATEGAFKLEATGKRVLHLATHGFFLDGRCASALDPGEQNPAGVPVAVTGENPMLLSGLVLAGANHRQVAGENEEDGILTAEEIAAMDLNGVEWVVLSACDTGVGPVKAGEGVFGLRRAFQVAGVRTIIMSLWPVEDRTARQWMTALYEGRFVKGLNTTEAVHQASVRILDERRAKGESTHPFYWAGFVAAGDWR
jgi:CHAT domain-containing protein/tetratricopeptide (TPR) repeat protein